MDKFKLNLFQSYQPPSIQGEGSSFVSLPIKKNVFEEDYLDFLTIFNHSEVQQATDDVSRRPSYATEASRLSVSDVDLQAFEQLNDLRVHAGAPERSSNGSDKLMKYYQLLCDLEKKFSSFGKTSLLFKWQALFQQRMIHTKCIQYEKAAVIWNLGALYSQLATVQSLWTAEGHKQAATYFQKAAGAFKFVRDRLVPRLQVKQSRCDFDELILTTAIQLMLAQAMECFYLKAEMDQTSSPVTSQVACQASDYYKMSEQSLSYALVYPKTFKKICQIKSLTFEAVAHFHFPNSLGPERAVGERHARLVWARELLNTALTNGTTALQPLIQHVFEKVQRDLNKVDYANFQDFHQTLVPREELSMLRRPPMSLVQSEPLPFERGVDYDSSSPMKMDASMQSLVQAMGTPVQQKKQYLGLTDQFIQTVQVLIHSPLDQLEQLESTLSNWFILKSLPEEEVTQERANFQPDLTNRSQLLLQKYQQCEAVNKTISTAHLIKFLTAAPSDQLKLKLLQVAEEEGFLELFRNEEETADTQNLHWSLQKIKTVIPCLADSQYEKKKKQIQQQLQNCLDALKSCLKLPIQQGPFSIDQFFQLSHVLILSYKKMTVEIQQMKQQLANLHDKITQLPWVVACSDKTQLMNRILHLGKEQLASSTSKSTEILLQTGIQKAQEELSQELMQYQKQLNQLAGSPLASFCSLQQNLSKEFNQLLAEVEEIWHMEQESDRILNVFEEQLSHWKQWREQVLECFQMKPTQSPLKEEKLNHFDHLLQAQEKMEKLTVDQSWKLADAAIEELKQLPAPGSQPFSPGAKKRLNMMRKMSMTASAIEHQAKLIESKFQGTKPKEPLDQLDSMRQELQKQMKKLQQQQQALLNIQPKAAVPRRASAPVEISSAKNILKNAKDAFVNMVKRRQSVPISFEHRPSFVPPVKTDSFYVQPPPLHMQPPRMPAVQPVLSVPLAFPTAPVLPIEEILEENANLKRRLSLQNNPSRRPSVARKPVPTENEEIIPIDKSRKGKQLPYDFFEKGRRSKSQNYEKSKNQIVNYVEASRRERVDHTKEMPLNFEFEKRTDKPQCHHQTNDLEHIGLKQNMECISQFFAWHRSEDRS